MTRINVVPVEELSDQYLLAEYRELPRVVKQDISVVEAPKRYCLGRGHMKWARLHMLYTLRRYAQIWDELNYRGFEPRYFPNDLIDIASKGCGWSFLWEAYIPDDGDIALNRQRLIEHYKPQNHTWTNRTKPDYYEGIE